MTLSPPSLYPLLRTRGRGDFICYALNILMAIRSIALHDAVVDAHTIAYPETGVRVLRQRLV